MNLRPLLTYYGGKQKMAKHILPLIPPHDMYVEPFAGGAAIFFMKSPSPVEVINDTNLALANFYKVAKEQTEALVKKIDAHLYSRSAHDFAWIVYNYPEFFNAVERAWSVYELCNAGFAGQMDGSWGYVKTSKHGGDSQIKKNISKLDEMKKTDASGALILAERLRTVQIENRDALEIIKKRDGAETFFYCDPPYYNTNMGHYGGYTRDNFVHLLEALSALRGKFILSCYDCPEVREYAAARDWSVRSFAMQLSAPKEQRRQKTECLFYNF